MGGGRDKRKKFKERKDGPSVGTGAIKTEKKTQKADAKKERRAAARLAGDEDDVEAMLAKFALEVAAKPGTPLIETDCPAPSPRVNSSFIPHIAPKVNDVIMFGGEAIDPVSGKVKVFNDLYKLNAEKAKWTKITSNPCPAPRCAHQSIIYKGQMYVFGGEITSPNQERFHHYREMWRMDLATFEWDQLPMKGSSCPSARSGHRMILHKNKAVMFGGFFDDGKSVQYFNELWVLNLDEMKWTCYLPEPGQMWPSPRSGCGVACHGDSLFVYGGYSKQADDSDKDIEHGKACEDMWVLSLLPTGNRMTWEKVKKAGMAPGPRASATLISHRNRAFVFGGVSDNELKGGEDMSSDFHNDLYLFVLDKRRWFAAEMRLGQNKDAQEPESSAETSTQGQGQAVVSSAALVSPELAALMERGQDKSSAIYKAIVKIQATFRGHIVRKAYTTYRLGGAISELLYSPAAYGLDLSIRNAPKPRGRINAQMAVVGNDVWLFGGIVEIGETEITLDDLWTLDLQKMDGWNLVKENTGGDEIFKRAAAAMGEESEEGSDWETDEEDEEEA
jgi:N-acetylneuraminic acid mutarotase